MKSFFRLDDKKCAQESYEQGNFFGLPNQRFQEIRHFPITPDLGNVTKIQFIHLRDHYLVC